MPKNIMDKRGILFMLFVFAIIFQSLVSAKISVTGDIISENAFEVNNILLKVTVVHGTYVEKSVSISSDIGGEFSLEVIGADGVFVKDRDFALNPGEEKKLALYFNSTILEPGVYAGSLRVSGGGQISYLPLIFEVESESLFFDVNLEIPPQYTEVIPGEKLVSNVDVFDLTGFQTASSLGPTDVYIEYTIKDLNGNIVSSESESLVLDGQTKSVKTIILPENIKTGGYFFIATVEYSSLIGASSRYFVVVESIKETLFEELDIKFITLLVFGLLILIALVILCIYSIKGRNKSLSNTKNSRLIEYEKQNYILAQEKLLRENKAKLDEKTRKETEERLVKIKEEQNKKDIEVKRNLERLNEEQKKKEESLRDMQNKKDIETMEKKLNEWKKAGYDTFALESKLKYLKPKELNALLAKWKKTGYKL